MLQIHVCIIHSKTSMPFLSMKKLQKTDLPPWFYRNKMISDRGDLQAAFCRKLPSTGRRRQWQPTPVLVSGKSHGRRSLGGCSPWGREESDTTEQLHFHFSLSCIGEGNGNPLQCSCLENPRDRGAWWAAVYGVTQSWTRLKWLSSSSSSRFYSEDENKTIGWECVVIDTKLI